MDIDIYPWTSSKRLYNRDGVSVIQTTESHWVVKHAQTQLVIRKEIDFLREGLALRNMIELPPDPMRQFGENWYAMRRYTGSVREHRDEVRGRWRQVGREVLYFLEDLHRKAQRVHLDITLKNILFDRMSSSFVVGDYELLESVNTDVALIDNDDDHLWYYIGAGAELTGSIHSWRMDLTMLGYCLDELARNRYASFDSLCQRRRNDTEMTMSDYDIIARRNKEMEECHPTVRAYLDRLNALVSWNDVTPPSATVYDELRALLVVDG